MDMRYISCDHGCHCLDSDSYFFMESSKKRNSLSEVHTSLAIGSRILFAGGLYGRVVGFPDDDTVNVEIAKGTVITISRYAIQSIEK